MKYLIILAITLSYVNHVSAVTETDKVKASVKSGKNKFSCTFTLVSDGDAVLLTDSKVVCTPNKPTKRKVKNFAVSTDKANYKLSFNINPEKLTKATLGKTSPALCLSTNQSIFRVEIQGDSFL